MKNLAALGKTVLLTTHYMDEAQYLADRVAVMAAGRIVATGTPEQLGDRQTDGVRIRFRVPERTMLPADLQGQTSTDGCVELTPDDLSQTLHRLTGWSIENGSSSNNSRSSASRSKTSTSSSPGIARCSRKRFSATPRPQRDHDEVPRAPGLPGPLRQQGLLA